VYKVLSLISTLLIALPSAAADEPAVAGGSDVDKLVALTGPADMNAQIAAAVSSQLNAQMKELGPDVPTRLYEVVDEVTTAEFERASRQGDDLQRRLSALYSKHFSSEEVRGLVSFYESPIGRRWLAEAASIAHGTQEIGQAWMNEVLPRIRDGVQEKIDDEALLGEE
jgi:hypothetical protein